MAHEAGITRDNFRELILEPLNLYRGQADTPGREIRLMDFINNEAPNRDGSYGLSNGQNEPYTWDSLLHEIGLEKRFEYATLNNLLALGGDLTYIAPEVVREFVLVGFETQASHLDLVASTSNVDRMTVTTPNITYTDADMEDIEQGETIPEAGVAWDKKTVEIGKKGIAIKFTDELRLSVAIPLLQPYLRRVGVQLAAKLYTAGVNILQNGDQAAAADSCAAIGVTTGGSLVFADFVRAWVRAAQIAFNWNTMITSEAMANTILGITEFKPNQGVGQAQVQIQSRNKIIPSSLPHMISSALSDDQVMLFDPAQAMQYLIFRPLLVESERLIMRQVEGTACTIISGFTTLDRNARIIIDKSLAFSGYYFPARMAPLV
jgi:hypothetical protein